MNVIRIKFAPTFCSETLTFSQLQFKKFNQKEININ